MKPLRGFSLIELLIVLAIVAILAAVALPSYQSQVIETRRTDAYAALSRSAQVLEQCFTLFGSYSDANCNIAFPFTSDEGFYSISAVLTASTFLLTATPMEGQTADTDCGSLTLDQLGQKGSDGPVTDCW